MVDAKVVQLLCRKGIRETAAARCDAARLAYETAVRLRLADAGEKLGAWCALHHEALREGNFGLPVPPPLKAPRPAAPRPAVPAMRSAGRSRFEPVALADGWTWDDRMRGEPLSVYLTRTGRR